MVIALSLVVGIGPLPLVWSDFVRMISLRHHIKIPPIHVVGSTSVILKAELQRHFKRIKIF